ncbi:MAG: sortase [Patescibacteria group bacterium]
MLPLFDHIWAKKTAFLGVFFLVFSISYLFLVAIDFVPEPKEPATTVGDTLAATAESIKNIQPEDIVVVANSQSGDDENEVAVASDDAVNASPSAVLPDSIHIARLNKTVAVLNPTSRTIADLDAALLDGVVRHPDSASLDQEGNMFILGHSSYLPNVINHNFQAFNGIQNLEWGDLIEVRSGESVYVYRVEKVYKAKVAGTVVPIAGTGNILTLATCNSFGSTDDRYIVEAKQVEALTS